VVVATAVTLAVSLTLAASGTDLAAAHTPPSDVHSRTATTSRVLHRVVWADDTTNHPGIRLSSARADGSGVRHFFSTKYGIALYLTLDPQGRRVAFTPSFTFGHPLPVLEVVSVLGGKVWKPLASYRSKFDWVWGIGWSPSGRRLAFQGGTLNANGTGVRTSALWTVRLDGTGLHRIVNLPAPQGDPGPLAWTRHGIMYVSPKKQLRIVRHGSSHLVLRHVLTVSMSGDGHHIVTWRATVRSHPESIWFSDPDGTHQQRLARWPWPKNATQQPPPPPGYYEATPNYDGSRILAERNLGPVVWWKTKDSSSTATAIPPVTGNNSAVTWN
jgi:hypothetical protein